MTPAEWRRAREILQVAIRRPVAERRLCIAERCGDDTPLRLEIENLLLSFDVETDLNEFFARHEPFSPDRASLDDVQRTRTTADAFPFNPAEEERTPHWSRFALLEEIGRGGFGVVHRAWDNTLRREVALKVIDVRRLQGSDNDGWLREGRMLARVRHANVVMVHSVERIGDEVGLAMEFIKGRTLANLVEQHGPLGAAEVLPIGVAVCEALIAVHRGGLIHRDLKASNVMRESGGRIVLMDFGAGREAVRDGEATSIVLGTPVYMSPETLLGARPTVASDVYSVGVLLFYLVSGRYPFAGSGVADLREAHRRGNRISLDDCRPGLPRGFVKVIERALDAHIEARPTSAAAFKRELLDSQAQSRETRGTRQHRDNTKERPATPPSRLSRLAAGALASLAVATVLGFLTTLEFNSVLGRSREFSDDPWFAVVTLGVQSIFGPLAHILLLILFFNILIVVARVAGSFIPAWQTWAVKCRTSLSNWAERSELNDPNLLLRGLAVCGLIWLAGTLAAFQPLLIALASPIDLAPAADIAVLRSVGNEEMKFLYRRLLEVDLVVLASGLLTILKMTAHHQRPIAPGAWISFGAVAALTILFLAAPWRIMFAADFPVASMNGNDCFVLGRRGPEILLHCPKSQPPRNRRVDERDPALRFGGAYGDLFDSYGAGIASNR